jgi:hypothetical protein
MMKATSRVKPAPAPRFVAGYPPIIVKMRGIDAFCRVLFTLNSSCTAPQKYLKKYFGAPESNFKSLILKDIFFAFCISILLKAASNLAFTAVKSGLSTKLSTGCVDS